MKNILSSRQKLEKIVKQRISKQIKIIKPNKNKDTEKLNTQSSAFKNFVK